MLIIGIIASHILLALIIYLIAYYNCKARLNKMEEAIQNRDIFNQALLDDDKQIIDELSKLLVEANEQKNKSNIDNTRN